MLSFFLKLGMFNVMKMAKPTCKKVIKTKKKTLCFPRLFLSFSPGFKKEQDLNPYYQDQLLDPYHYATITGPVFC